MATGQNIPNSPTPPKRPWLPLLIAGGAIVLLVILTTIIISFTQGGTMTKEQAAMERYLEEKYRQEFVVEKPKYTHGGFGVDGIWVATAHPKNDPSLVFDMDGVKDLSKIYDQYIAALWSKEQTQRIQPEVEKIYGKDTTTKVTVRIVFSGDIAQDTTLTASGYEEAKAKYADRGLYYEYNIVASSASGTSTEARRIYELIELARKNEVGKSGVRYIEKQGQDQWLSILESSVVESITNATEVEEQLNNNRIKVED